MNICKCMHSVYNQPPSFSTKLQTLEAGAELLTPGGVISSPLEVEDVELSQFSLFDKDL